MAASSPNDDFICPLTLRVMHDPVMTMNGHSFERTAIIDWLGRGNTTCPLSRQQLHVNDLVSNHCLHSKINVWKSQQQRVFESTSTTDIDHGITSSDSCFDNPKSKSLEDDPTRNFVAPFFVNVSSEREDFTEENFVQRRIENILNNQEQWELFQQLVQIQLKNESDEKVQQHLGRKLLCGLKNFWNDFQKRANILNQTTT